MPRRGNVPKREVLPDPLYNSVLVTKLTNSIMLDGKKGVAQKVVYGAFDIIKDKTGKEPMEVYTQALENIMPSLEVKARRVGGATYQVPIEVRPERRQTLGNTVMEWDSLTVTWEGGSLVLPQKEFMLLYKMASFPGRIFTRQQLMDEIWGYETDSDAHTVEVHVGRLRERFRDNPDFKIVTIRGVGYKVVKL